VEIDFALQLPAANWGLLDGTNIAEFARVVIPLSVFSAFGCLIGLTLHTTMRLRSVVYCWSTITFPYRRTVFIQFTKICHRSTFLIGNR
jgi:hypothetical protein